MNDYIKVWWDGLNAVGRTVVSVVAAVVGLVGFALMLLNAAAFERIVQSLAKLWPH